MNKEKITAFIENENGFRINLNNELSTRKVIINNIEITSIEDWNKVVDSIAKLQQENKQLKEQVQDLKADYGTIAQIERDLYKDVIEEVKNRITIKLGRYINEKDYVIDDVALDELLQILDKVKD